MKIWNVIPFCTSTLVIFNLLVLVQSGNTTEFINSEASIYDHVKWGTNATRRRDPNKHNGFAYFGIGSCDKRESSLEELQRASTTNYVIRVYAKVMRIDCNKDLVASLASLFSLEYIHLKKDHSVDLNLEFLQSKGPPYLKQYKEKIFLAFRLAVVSQIYVSMQQFPVAPNTPDGDPVSDQIFAVVNMMLGMLEVAAKYLDPVVRIQFSKDFLNLGNSLVPVVVDAAYLRFSFSRFSKHEKQTALNDIIMVSAIREYIFELNRRDKGLAKASADLHPAFRAIFHARKKVYLKAASDLYPWIKKKLPL